MERLRLWQSLNQNSKKHNKKWQPCDHRSGLDLPGTEVPKATKAIALTVSFKKMKHPKWEAISPITAVIRPIVRMDTVNVIYPPCKPNEGTTVIYAYAYQVEGILYQKSYASSEMYSKTHQELILRLHPLLQAQLCCANCTASVFSLSL